MAAASSCSTSTSDEYDQDASATGAASTVGTTSSEIAALVELLEKEDVGVAIRAAEVLIGVCHGSDSSVKAIVAKAVKASAASLFDRNPTCAMSIVVACGMTELNLRYCLIGTEGGKVIAAGLAGSQLTTLYLGGNEIGAVGGKAIGAGLAGSQLTTLNLRGNGIGDEGCKAIGAGLAGGQLTTLILWDNIIGDEGMAVVDAGVKRNLERRKRFLVVGWRVCVNAWRFQ